MSSSVLVHFQWAFTIIYKTLEPSTEGLVKQSYRGVLAGKAVESLAEEMHGLRLADIVAGAVAQERVQLLICGIRSGGWIRLDSGRGKDKLKPVLGVRDIFVRIKVHTSD